MRAGHIYAAAACILFRTAAAVFADDAWNVDYQLALLGLPQEQSTFFHAPVTGSKASLLYTLSESAVLGAVNPRDGAIVWRQQLGPKNGSFGSVRAGEGQDLVISACNGQVAAWGASDGRQAWSVGLVGEEIADLEILELDDGRQNARTKDALVLSAGETPVLRRIDGSTGAVKWLFKDESGDAGFQVSASATQVVLVSLHSTMLGGTKIRVTSLDPTNGHKTDQYTLSSDSDISSSTEILSVGANTAFPIIAWTDKAKSVLKVNVIGSKSTSSFDIKPAQGQTVDSITLHASYHTTARPHFLAHYQTADQHWAEVYHVDLKAATVSKAYSLPKVHGKGAFSTSSSDANVYFTRVAQDEVSVVSSASHGILARWAIPRLAGSPASDSNTPVHAVSEVSVKGDVVSAARSAVLLSSGDWILIRDGTVSWSRLEALAKTVAAVWAYPSNEDSLVSELEKEAHATALHSYIHRLQRHIRELQGLPTYLSSLSDRVLGSLGIGNDPSVSASGKAFGYRKTVVCATSGGRAIGLDAGAQGRILWNVPIASTTLSSIHLVSNTDGTVTISDNEGTQLTTLNSNSGTQVTASGRKNESRAPPKYSYDLSQGRLSGGLSGRSTKEPLWRYLTRQDETVTSVISRPREDPVASIGKVLGDRRVLYKYLNPNLLLVTATSESSKTATISLVDSLTGLTLFSTSHQNVQLALPIPAALSENWFAYSIAVNTDGSAAKGYQLVIGELYESSLPNDRGPLATNGNMSAVSFDYQPDVLTQTYSIAEPISHLTVTQTAQGITSRALLATLAESGSLVAIPRVVIDPRRPTGRDPTSDEAMEGLMRYTPQLEFDPKWYLNHRRQLLGIEQVTTSPAVLESTSLVFAYGLDIFGTRISPSFSFDVLGKDFNKLQMLATVAALAVGTLLVAPLVARKQVNGRWQFA